MIARKMSNTFLLGATGALVLSLLVAHPANAEPSSTDENSDAIAAIDNSAPGLLDATDPTVELEAVKTDGSISLDVPAPDSVTTSTSTGVEQSVEQAPLSIEVVGDYTPSASTESGTLALSSNDDDSTVVVQPLSEGIRLLSVIPSEGSSHEFKYALNLPDDAALVKESDGSISVTSATINGVFAPPWARDAAGTDVKTWYELEGHTLVQQVAPTDSAVYPVVADPSWGYSRIFNVHTSYLNAWAQLTRCFNCEFPVQGAPRNFPAMNQVMPLKVCFGPICGPFPVAITNIYRAPLYAPGIVMTLTAAKGHVDGEGSTIKFGFWPKGSESQLRVDTVIKNNYGPLNVAYTDGAVLTWNRFAVNLSS